jgi:proteasome accessory factor C
VTVRRGPRPAQERLRRLLVMLPWLMERGEAPVAEIAKRFHLSERHVIADLELAALCGLPPYLDEMIDLYIDDENVVHCGVPRLFTRPLRLTPAEGFSLLAAGQAALRLPGAEPAGPLARALGKLERALGAHGNLAIDVDRPPFVDVVAAAARDGQRLLITYYSASRDELTERRIDPLVVFTDRGRWYVIADCSSAGAERTFRVDRIESAVPTGETFVRRDVPSPVDDGWFTVESTVATVTLDLPPDTRWVIERYPTHSVDERPDGWLRVELPVTSERWLSRLLLRVGPGAIVVAPEHWRTLAADTAARALARYR